MVRALEVHGAEVLASDLHNHGFDDMFGRFDFVSAERSPLDHFDMIITNCPYGVQGKLAEKFIRRGLERLAPGGVLALLLQADFDSASTRRDIFSTCSLFAGRIVLNRRIVWFEPPKPQPGEKKPSGPSANHTWFLWSRPRIKAPHAPFTLYGPSREVSA